ncbi:MAG: carotenoid oxygenase family protein [Rubrivivax sp.]
MTISSFSEKDPVAEAFTRSGLAGRDPFRATTLHPVRAQARVEGQMPCWLAGDLLRTAPAGFATALWSASHWFDGIGMLYQFRVLDGRVEFSQRLLECRGAHDAAAGALSAATFATPMRRPLLRRLFQPIPQITDNTNVNVIPYDETRVALTEGAQQLVIDKDTLRTTGRIEWSDREGAILTIAHPHFDFENKVVVGVALVLAGTSPHVLVYEHAPSERVRRPIARVRRGALPYVHSFGLTPAHVVLIDHPLRVKPARMLWSELGFIDHFRWTPEDGTTLVRIDRRTGEQHLHHAPAHFVFHVINTFEEADATILDVVAHDVGVVDRLRSDRLTSPIDGRYLRWTMRHGRRDVEEVEISGAAHEFPNVDYRRVSGRKHRRSWGATNVEKAGLIHSEVVAIDVTTASMRCFHDEHFIIGEPVFVGRPGAADVDDGVVLAVGGRLGGDESRLYVLDSRTMEARATVSVPYTVPLGFHGNFFPSRS